MEHTDKKYLEEEQMNAGGAQFDQYADTYDDGMKQLLALYGGGDTYKFAEYKVALLHDLLGKRGIRSILDFGCGTGRSLKYFDAYFGTDVTKYGCDVSVNSLRDAAKLVPSATFFCNETVDRFLAEDHTYDLVFISCVLHHIDPSERAAWLAAIAQKLNAGGYIAVFEHNIQNLVTKKIVLDPANKVDDIHWMLSHKEIIDLLTGANKSLQRYWDGYTLFSPFRFPGVLYLERLLSWLPLGAQQCVIVKRT